MTRSFTSISSRRAQLPTYNGGAVVSQLGQPSGPPLVPSARHGPRTAGRRSSCRLRRTGPRGGDRRAGQRAEPGGALRARAGARVRAPPRSTPARRSTRRTSTALLRGEGTRARDVHAAVVRGAARGRTPGRITRVRGRLSEPCLGAEPLRCRAADAGRARPHVPRGRADRAGVRAAHVGAARGGNPAAAVRDAVLRPRPLGCARLRGVRRTVPRARDTPRRMAAGGGRPARRPGARGRVPARRRGSRARDLRRARGRAGPSARGVRRRARGRRPAARRLQHVGVRLAVDARVHERAEGARGKRDARRRRERRRVLRRRLPGSPCGRLAPRVGEGPADRDAAGACGGGRTTAPVPVGAACGDVRLRGRPAPLPCVQRRVLPPVRRPGSGPPVPDPRAAVPRPSARLRASCAAAGRGRDRRRVDRRHGPRHAHRAADRCRVRDRNLARSPRPLGPRRDARRPARGVVCLARRSSLPAAPRARARGRTRAAAAPSGAANRRMAARDRARRLAPPGRRRAGARARGRGARHARGGPRRGRSRRDPGDRRAVSPPSDRPAALLAVAPALVLAAPQLTSRPRWSLLVATFVLGLAAVVWARGRNARARVGTTRAGEPPQPEGPLATPP